MTDDPPVVRAIKIAGSEAKLAEAVGCSQPAINKAKRRGKTSAALAIAIETAVGGQVTRAELCPEIFGIQAEGAASCPAP